MRTAVVKLGLLLSAFSPLLIAISLVKVVGTTNYSLYLWTVAAALPLAFLWLVLRAAARLPAAQLTPTQTRRQDEQVLAFTASYILPLVALFLGSDLGAWVAAAVLLALLVLVYVRGDLVHLNPVLTAIGYRLYAVEQVNGTEVMLLTRSGYVQQHADINDVVQLSDHVYLQWRKR